MSLAELSRTQIWSCLSKDARESLIGDIYVPYVRNITEIFLECDDLEEDIYDDDIQKPILISRRHLEPILAEFVEKFPELVVPSPEVISTKYRWLGGVSQVKRYGGENFNVDTFNIQVQLSEGSGIICNVVPFNFHRNNQLITFFMKHDMPVESGFCGIKKANDTT